ncbi:MAG TPA: cupin domain-containing protein [Tepidisphaeraceae bacterium]|nr:cupin domain-containing protein [Tepidisphaeraceae bacterium]
MRMVEVDIGPVVLEAGEGVWLGVLGDLYRFLVTGRATDGQYAVNEIKSFPGNGPPLHIHHRESEAFYVLEGRFLLTCGDRMMHVTPGAFVHVPAGTLHTFKNIGSEPGRLLVVITPAGLEGLLEEVGQPVEDTFSEPPIDPAAVQRLLALAPQYHLEIRL